MDWAVGGMLALILGMLGLQSVLEGVAMALRTAQRSRLVQWQAEQRYGATAALALHDRPEPCLLTVHLGLTVSMVTLAASVTICSLDVLWPWLRLTRWGGVGLLVVVMGVLVYVLLVVGHLVPRSLAQQSPEHVLCWSAPLFLRLTRLSDRLQALCTGSATGLLWVLGQRHAPVYAPPAPITEEEVTTLVREGTKRGIFEEVEQELIAGVFEFTDTAVREIMVPRVRMQALDVAAPPDAVMQHLLDSGHSRLPVYEGDLDHIVGVLYFKDVMRAMRTGHAWEVRRLLRPAVYVPEMVQISRLLRLLQQRRLHLALVVDEHGGVAGLVTIEDLLEQLVGDIRDEGEPEADPLVTLLPDGALVAQGNAPLEELCERYHLPLPTAEQYHTIAGLLLARLGRIPQGGETITEQGYVCTVVDMDGPRIARVRIERRDDPAHSAEIPRPGDKQVRA